jgi:radical SAM protein with 4Fe4S-binding SPASM domain
MPLITKKRKAKFFKTLKITRLPYLPFILGIEPGNICNLHCPLCPTGKNESGVTKGFIKFELFKEIIDQLKDSLTTINLYNWGEPLLNKEFISIITYTKQLNKDIRICTSTNLNIRNNKLLEDLILSGIDEIIISCDGVSQVTYEKYRRGGDFQLVVENMKFLVKKNKELNKNTLLVWNFLVFKHNEHEVKIAKEMAEKIGVVFRIGLMRTSMKDEILKPHEESIKQDIDWIPDNPDYSAYDKEKYRPKKIIKTCRKPWQEISINWDGKVFACCAIFGENFNFGDASKDSIINIWNNKLFISARESILGKKIKINTICSLCKKNGFMHM